MAYKQQRRAFDFLLPFLIFISLGVIIILGIQLWQTIQPQKLKSEAYLYIANGRTQILPWGLDQWEPGANGSKILQGDSIKTSSKGHALLKLYDGTVLRIGPHSEININKLSQEKKNYSAEITLESGSIWTKTGKQRNSSSTITIRTNHLKATTKGTIFNVSTQPNEKIDLIKGNLEIEIIVQKKDQEKTVEKIQLNSGKTITLSPSTIRKYENHESPQTISSISKEFINSDWYKWNTKEDTNPTDYSQKTTSQIKALTETAATPETTNSEQTENNDNSEKDDFEKTPIITKPANSPYTTKKETIRIEGSAPTNTEKIIIITTEKGKEDSYILRNYKAGDSSWSYTASTKYGNLESGKNKYLIYAENKDGIRSKASKLIIIYKPQTQKEATPENDS